MASFIGLVRRNLQIFNPTEVPKATDTIKIGVLGAADITPRALIQPARSHPEVVVQSVAARKKERAVAYAKKHSIPHVADSYQAILDDPTIDAVYIPLPVSLHEEWSLKALAKGKHVLLEKPSVANTEDAEALFRSPLLKQPNAPVLVEAVHYRFQPAWSHFMSLVDQPNIDHVVSVGKVPWYFVPGGKGGIRFDYTLAGGAILDIGTYPISTLRQVMGAEPEECTKCTVRKAGPPNDLCDEAAEGSFIFSGGRVGEFQADLQGGITCMPEFSVTVKHKEVAVPDTTLPKDQEKVVQRTLVMNNFIMANFWHRIDIADSFTIRRTADKSVVKRWTKKESKKAYTFKEIGIDQPSDPSWISYRHQLEQFVNRIKGRKGTGLWIDPEDSIGQSRTIDMAYEKSGLPLRPASKFQL